MSDNPFFSLPDKVQQIIDHAFSAVAKPVGIENNYSKSVPQAGGFLPEDSSGFIREDDAGGFLRDSSVSRDAGGFLPDSDVSIPNQIPLSEIPFALQILDLPPDDEEVLAVFRNAATGWSSFNITNDGNKVDDEGYVSKEDWRSVCAVLLELDSHSRQDEDVAMSDFKPKSDEASDSDEYIESDFGDATGDDDNEDDDEYMEDHRRRRRTKISHSSLSSEQGSPLRDTTSFKLTACQKQACLDAYGLFFPTSTFEKLSKQRLMLKDIQQAAKLLNEKIKAEEMLEMLETFSTSPDKSMTFDDFCRMMIRTKLA